MSLTPQNQKIIRQQVLRAISSNREPGMHFAGYFLNFTAQRFKTDGVEFTVEAGPHCTDANGAINRAALLYSADMTLAAANRVFTDPNARTATLMLRVEFTGEAARGKLEISGRGSGFDKRTALPESVAAGRVMCEGREIMRMSGTWVEPPAPKGMVMRALPWEGGASGALRPLLKKSELDAVEKDVVRRVDKAMRNASAASGVGMFASLCNPLVKRTAQGANGRLPVGMHIGNRVGHVQGGFLISAALVTAEAAVPEHPILTGASAWYISPGQGKVITSRATILQSGRNVAVVRTELFAAGRKRVLEVISNHSVGTRAA